MDNVLVLGDADVMRLKAISADLDGLIARIVAPTGAAANTGDAQGGPTRRRRRRRNRKGTPGALRAKRVRKPRTPKSPAPEVDVVQPAGGAATDVAPA